ncbi:MAG: carboxypeptidase-like regulatory domain-containing protein [Fibrobacterota bacterium]
MFRTWILLITLLAVMTACSGGDTLAGGNSSETTNGMVAVTDSASAGYSGSTVKLIADTAIPGRPGYSELTASTDNQGRAHFDSVPGGTYTVIARDSTGRAAALGQLTAEQDSAFFMVSTLRAVGSIYLTLDTALADPGDTFYFLGTDIARTLSESRRNAGEYSLHFDSLPPGALPPFYAGDSLIAPSKDLHLSPGDSLTISIDSIDGNLPLWRFSVLGRVSDSVLAGTGGLAEFRDSLSNQIDRAEDIINSNELAGRVDFYLDSVYSFAEGGTLADVPQTFDYYFDFHKYKPAYPSFDDIGDTRGMISWDTAGMAAFFTIDKNRRFASWLARFRGAYQFSRENVSREVMQNHFGITYEYLYDDTTLVDFPLYSNTLSELNRYILNYNGDKTEGETGVIYQMVPDTVHLSIIDSLQNPRGIVDFEAYGVSWKDGSIGTSPILFGTTDTLGRVDLGSRSLYTNYYNRIVMSNIIWKLSPRDTSVTYYISMPLSQLLKDEYASGDNKYAFPVILK